ncbi:MAG: ABC transporter permease [Lentisphaeria bacterium]|nr:ABC transporter permease [Lentisphaeria bacterium]
MNHFFLLRQMVLRDIQSRFRGSILGWLWNFLLPLLMLTVYTVVFGGFFKSRWGRDIGENKMVFATVLFSGITLYNIFSESVSLSTSCILGNVNYVKKVRFKLELLPLSRTLSTSIMSLSWILLLLIAAGIVFRSACWSWILLPLTLIPLVLFSAGISFFTSALGVYFRDLQYLIGILLQMLFFLSPVFYRLGSLPEEYRKMLRWNPMVWFIEVNRGVLFHKLLPEYALLPSAGDLLTCYALGGIVFVSGCLWFRFSKKGFGDVL